MDGAIYDPGKSGFQSLSISSWTGRTTHFDIDEIEAMDETKGAAVMNLPADAVREVAVSRVTPEVFQSLNGNGAVRVQRASGGDAGMATSLAISGISYWASPVFPGNSDYSRQQYGFESADPGRRTVSKGKAFVFLGGDARSKTAACHRDRGFDSALEQGSHFNTTALQRIFAKTC